MTIEKGRIEVAHTKAFSPKAPRLEMFYTYRVKLVSIVMGTHQIVSLTKRRLPTRICRILYRSLEQT